MITRTALLLFLLLACLPTVSGGMVPPNYLLLPVGITVLLLLAMTGAVYHHPHRCNLNIVQQLCKQDKPVQDFQPATVSRQADCTQATQGTTNVKARILADLNLLMEEKYYLNTGITRESLAEKLMTNETYLREVIMEQFGYTFTDYIVRLRLNHARMLLMDGALAGCTIESIAMDSGFNSRTTFYRQFKQKYGMSPEEYRRLAVE